MSRGYKARRWVGRGAGIFQWRRGTQTTQGVTAQVTMPIQDEWGRYGGAAVPQARARTRRSFR